MVDIHVNTNGIIISESRCLIFPSGWINETSSCLVSTNRETDDKTNNTKVITGPGVDSTAQVVGTGSFFGDVSNAKLFKTG